MAQTNQLSITTTGWTQVPGLSVGMLVFLEARFAFYVIYSNSTPALAEGYLIEDDKDTASSVCQFSDTVLGTLWVRSKNVNQTVFYTAETNALGSVTISSGTVTANLGTIAGVSTETTLSAVNGKLPATDNSKVPVIPSMTTGGNISATTAATGTNWTAFGSQALKQLTISNQTGTTIEFRQGGSGVGFQVPSGGFYTFFGITNANQIDIRRVDTSNVQVTVTARWES